MNNNKLSDAFDIINILEEADGIIFDNKKCYLSDEDRKILAIVKDCVSLAITNNYMPDFLNNK